MMYRVTYQYKGSPERYAVDHLSYSDATAVEAWYRKNARTAGWVAIRVEEERLADVSA